MAVYPNLAAGAAGVITGSTGSCGGPRIFRLRYLPEYIIGVITRLFISLLSVSLTRRSPHDYPRATVFSLPLSHVGRFQRGPDDLRAPLCPLWRAQSLRRIESQRA